MSLRPPLGIEVTLERAGRPRLSAEVSARDGAHMVLTPRSPAEEVPAESGEVTVSWSTDRGVFRAPGTVEVDGHRLRLTMHASATRTQRREYVRLPMNTQMTLAYSDGVARGTLIDLSEAALRTRLPSAGAPLLQAGDEVRAAFSLHHTGFMLLGTVLRAQDSGEPGTIDIVVMLDIPARTANDLRRNVVFEQIARQSELHESADETVQDQR